MMDELNPHKRHHGSSNHTDHHKNGDVSVRTAVKYEVDGAKTAPKIIMINRTEPQKSQDLVGNNSSGAYVETTLNLKISSSKNSAQPDLNLKGGFQKVASNWKNDKKSLQDLNERLSNYIDKARFLEQQNKKVSETLDQLRRNWVTETMKVKEEYSSQLVRHRKALEEAEISKLHMQVQLASLDDRYSSLLAVFEDAQRRNALDVEEIDRLKELIEEYESELNLLRKRVASFDAEKEKELKEIQRLRQNIEGLRIKLDEETESHILAEHAVQNNREALEFMKAIHEAELKELEGLIYKDNSSENRNFWKNELAQALEEIQAEYDNQVSDVKAEMEITCEKTVAQVLSNQKDGEREGEVKTSEELISAKESSADAKRKCKELESQLPELQEKQRRLQARLAELRHLLDDLHHERDKDKSLLLRQLSEAQNELDHVMAELKTLLDAKLSLDLQIAAYRKLIEGEEAREKRDVGNSAARDMISLLMVTGGGGDSAGAAGGEEVITTNIGKRQATQRSKRPQVEIEVQPDESSSREQISIFKDISSSELLASEGIALEIAKASAEDSGAAIELTSVSDATISSKSELNAKTTFQRTSRGVVTIKECATDGKYIRLEYNNKKIQRREDLSSWKLSRRVDEQAPVEFVFPKGVFMEPEGKLSSIVIWAQGAKPGNAGPTDLEMNYSSWGIGANIITSLIGAQGEEKATHTQRTAFTSS